ncbi:hypothetical protein DITRI_Ditri19aG0066100 [Diplodiscus trichospermus]
MSSLEEFSPGISYDQLWVPLLVGLLMPRPSIFWASPGCIWFGVVTCFLQEKQSIFKRREDAEKDAGTKSCFYCNKLFNNYRALGGHLRIHREDKILRSLNYPGHSSNSMDITRNPPASLPNCEQNPLSGGNKISPFTRAPPPFDFPRMFCSNETNQASSSKFTGSSPGVAQTQLVMSPDFSHGCGSGATYHHNISASREFASAGANAAASSNALASPDSVVATGFPVDSSLYLGSNGICQFNTDEFRISQDRLPPSSGGALHNIQGYNLGKLSSDTFAITNPDLGFESYKLPGLKESIAVCTFSPGPLCSSLDKVGQHDGRSLLTSEEGKRPYIADGSGNADIMNASKKPRIAPVALLEPEKLQKKELLLFKDVGVSLPASETCFGAEEEGPVDIDLSLHL